MNRLFSETMAILLLISSVQCNRSTLRQTNNGPIKGLKRTSLFGTKYYSFRGIPYAEVPITGIDPYSGEEVDRRFKAPQQLMRKWTEPLKTQYYGDGCIVTTNFFPEVGNKSENCLFLNVFVPAGGAKKKTVLVFIHPGAFTEGTADNVAFGPDFLIDADNILVTMNYRLGPFGFMNLGFGEYTGNMGLKDQQLAMQWTYENIENFSGNKDEILLFGQSAGGASVNFHILNAESRKYFNRAFAMSSSALNHYALYEPNHLERMQNFANIQDKQKLIEYLKTADSGDLAKAEPLSKSTSILLEAPWVPTVENPGTKGAFITKSPEELYKSGEAPAMDTMFSFVSQEHITFNHDLTRNIEPFLGEDWKNSELLLPFYGFTKNAYPEQFKGAFELLKEAYFNDTSNINAIKRQNIDLLSDMNFAYGILKAAQYQVEVNNKGTPKNTFVLRFRANTHLNLVSTTSLYIMDYNEAAHADDLCFIFRCGVMDIFGIYDYLLAVRDNSNVNYRTIKRMVNIITNFARTGDPSVKGDTPFKSSTSPYEMFSQDITNKPKSSLVTNILEQTHFDTWNTIDNTYQQLKSQNPEIQESNKTPKSQDHPTDQGFQKQLQNAYTVPLQLLLQFLNLA